MPTDIPRSSFISYARHDIDNTDVKAVSDILRGDWLTIGPKVDEFESKLSDYLGASTTVVSSGTAALHAAYHAIGVSKGDEVITPPLTFIATQATAMHLGATPVFVDIDINSANLDPNLVERAITPKTKAIVTVDYAGQPGDIEALRKIADKHNLYLVEDAAHSIGSTLNGKRVGSLADITTYSFFSTKNITSGEGGAVSSTDNSLVEKVRNFTHQGLIRDPKKFKISTEGPWHQEVQEIGLNYRLPDILCALGISQLERIEQFKRRRKEIFNIYTENFSHIKNVETPFKAQNSDPMWHLYPLRVPADKRLQIFQYLRQSNIMVQVNYLPAYRHPVFENYGIKREDYPNSEEYYSREISLPLNTYISDAEIQYVIEKVQNALTWI
jgi:dTDP-4-amino-4,6-dideoxygalactose transaminase